LGICLFDLGREACLGVRCGETDQCLERTCGQGRSLQNVRSGTDGDS
jgi:hypothetical protein